ncbi:MAG: succinylglutamate desuccinylase, partial [Butyrivibrio sp.]|nr:succinylglutamate desuccinylase [Butyrivibrio sp.]
GHEGYISHVVQDTDMVSVRTGVAGIFESEVAVGDEVLKGQILARILNPYEGEVKAILQSPMDGIVFFAHNEPLTYADTAVFKMICRVE